MSGHFILFIWASVNYKRRKQGEKYPPHKTFTSSDLCRGVRVQLFLEQMFLCTAPGVERAADWSAQDSEWNNQTNGDAPSFSETRAVVRSLIWNKVFGKGNWFLFSLWKPGEVGTPDVVTARKYFLVGSWESWTCLKDPMGKSESPGHSYKCQFMGWGHGLRHGL